MTSSAVRRLVLAVVLATSAVLAGPLGAPAGADTTPADLRLNQVQVVGSHNSYKTIASPEESAIRRSFIGAGEDLMLYDHAPLPEQFSYQGVRQIELDVFRDDAGGRYANPLLRQAAGHGPHDPVMAEPGTKVLHIQDVDYRSTCLTLVACLEAIEGWSDAHPDHMPIAILVELKDTPLELGDIEFTLPEPWTAAAMDALDEEILSVVPRDEVITPDDVRGDHDTLEEAVLSDGWPTLDESRGKVMFLMDNGGGYRTDYLAGHASLEGRVLFTNASPGDADAAFVKVNEPRGNVARIQGLVEDGYVVRTRADADTVEARTGDTSGRDAAFESGAQWVSTDYPVPESAEELGTGYVVQVPGGEIARCNPVSAPDGCVDATIEPRGPDDPAVLVEALYGAFLGRTPGLAEREHWTRRIRVTGDRLAVALAIATSREANHGTTVVRTYEAFLGRTPQAGEREYWGGRLDRRTALCHVQASVLGSDELWRAAGSDADAWVQGLFQRVLGRSAAPAAVDHFRARLATRARTTVAREVLQSREGLARTATQLVAGVHGRAATPEELTLLTGVLRSSCDARLAAAHLLTATTGTVALTPRGALPGPYARFRAR